MNRKASVFLVAMSLPFVLQAADAGSSSPLSRYGAEHRYNELADQSSAVQKEIATLTAHLQLLDSIQKRLKDVQLSDATVGAAIKKLQDAFRTLDGLPANEQLKSSHVAVNAVENARGEVIYYARPIDELIARVRSATFSRQVADPVIESIKASFDTDHAPAKPALLAEQLGSLMTAIPDDGITKKGSTSTALWAAARSEVAALNADTVRHAFNTHKESRIGYVTEMIGKFKSQIEARASKLSDLDKALNELDKSLQDQKQQKGALDRS